MMSSLAEGHQLFGGTFCLHLQTKDYPEDGGSRFFQCVSPSFTKPHAFIHQKSLTLKCEPCSLTVREQANMNFVQVPRNNIHYTRM
jgi:hypothetical protein